MKDEELMEINRKNWNARVPIHKQSRIIYNIEEFKSGKLSFVSDEDLELGSFIDIKGKSLLHLQCHFGLDSLSWSRLGANVTGVDFSEESINLANSIRDELDLNVKFICSNIYDLDLRQQFDIVFTSCGVLPWLPDLNKWAQIIVKHLKPEGVFYIKESHPITHSLNWDAKSPEELFFKYPYFNSKQKSLRFDEEWTYAHEGTDEKLAYTTHYEWIHPLSEIINSLVSAGIKILDFRESTLGFFQSFEFMRRNENGKWVFPDKYSDLVPLTFTIIGQKL